MLHRLERDQQDVDRRLKLQHVHRLQVIYVSDSIANDLASANVLLKSMRRVMAAEYSRDIAQKSRTGQKRVVAMGFHMGPLPAFGYRRCSVSADGKRRALLDHGERKLALANRIEWVLGPAEEVALVRRICGAYAAGVALEDIAGLVRAGGWRTDKGKLVSTYVIKNLPSNEALIGNLVWGVKSRGVKVIKVVPTCMDGRRTKDQ
jgi:Recombinase